MRDGLIRSGAVLVSLLLHGIWFVQAGGESGVKQALATPPQTTVTRLTFTMPQQEIVEKKPKPVEKRVEPVEKRAKPVKKEIVQNDPEPEPPQEEQLESIPEVATAAPMLDEGIIERERERYLAEVMALIEHHKRYPKTARRRGITGVLSVSFLLMHDGTVQGLVIRDGPDVLIGAARDSVERAQPMPEPPVSVDCPLRCRFRMKFSLDEV